MLSDLSKCYDTSNMSRVIERLPVQIETALDVSIPQVPVGPFNRVAIAGMGGSALPVNIIRDAFAEKIIVPVMVTRHYNLPLSVDEKTLVIVSSFSGNTEEVLSIVSKFPKGASNVAIISGGGRLAAIAEERGYPLVRIPKEAEPPGFQPRSAVGYFVTLLSRLLFNSGVMDNPIDELKAVPEILRSAGIRIDAEDAATWLQNKIPVVYTDETYLMSIARIAKIKFNENAKRPAFFNALPEANHNEMIGFSKPQANFGILYFHDPGSHPRIISRYKLMKEMFATKRFDHVDFRKWEMPGITKIQKIMASIMYADWCSYSLALFDGIDPTPCALTEIFKKELGQQR